MEIISTAIAYMAGYNIRLLPIIQSMAQLDAVYGKDVSRTMITNHALQIVYAPREQQDANDYSEMLGYTTVRKRNRSRSYGQQGNYTLSENEKRRALMLPQELKALGNDKEVFFYEGIPHPVLCEKIKYFKDKHFTSRLLPKVKIKPLQIGDGPMPNKVQDTISAVATLALAACAVQPVAGTAQAAPQEISQTAQAALGESAVPKNPAEALGQKLLKLVGGLKTTSDFTLERVSDELGVEIPESQRSPGIHETEIPLIDRRSALVRFKPASEYSGETLWLAITRSKDDPDSGVFPLTDVCLEFEPFATALEGLGYTREARLYRGVDPIGSWRFYRRKPDHEYTDVEMAMEMTDPLKGAGPVEISVSRPEDELIDAAGKDAGGRRCIVHLEIEAKGDSK